jgi:hypothetical protein
MNYYEPREKTDKDGNPTGLYHYTRMNDGRIWPTGYCAQDCPGHDTKEGAYEHQRQYLLDNAKFDSGKFKDALFRCDVPDCKNFSDTSSRVQGQISSYTLCEEHRNRAGLEKVLKVGDVISSW